MNEHDKKLLVQYLCAALPHKLIVSPINCAPAKLIGFEASNALLYDLSFKKKYTIPWEIEYVKPFLYSMDDMTDEEKKEYHDLCFKEERKIYELGDLVTRVYYHDTVESLYWLISHRFDCFRLIDKGLAIRVTEDFNPYKELKE